MSDILNKTIKITSVEDKEVNVRLKDQDNLSYSFFKTKKSGEDTKPYASFKSAELKSGDTIRIGYVLEEYEYKGKPVKSKKIISFAPASNDEIAQVSKPAEPTYTKSNDEVDWDAKDRLHAAQTAVNFVASVDQATGKEFNQAKANDVYNYLIGKKSGNEPLQQTDVLDKQPNEETISTEDIPF